MYPPGCKWDILKIAQKAIQEYYSNVVYYVINDTCSWGVSNGAQFRSSEHLLLQNCYILEKNRYSVIIQKFREERLFLNLPYRKSVILTWELLSAGLFLLENNDWVRLELQTWSSHSWWLDVILDDLTIGSDCTSGTIRS